MRLIGLLWWWKFLEFPPVSIHETTNMFKMSFGSIKTWSDFKNVLNFLISNRSPGFKLKRLINFCGAVIPVFYRCLQSNDPTQMSKQCTRTRNGKQGSKFGNALFRWRAVLFLCWSSGRWRRNLEIYLRWASDFRRALSNFFTNFSLSLRSSANFLSISAIIRSKFSRSASAFRSISRQSALGMGQRNVISVTKNEAKNEAGCYQNRIASHFNRSARTASCNLVNLKIT